MTILGSLLFILGFVLVALAIVTALIGPSIIPGTPPWKVMPGPFWIGATLVAATVLRLVFE